MKRGRKLTSILLCLVIVLLAFCTVGIASFASGVTPGSKGEIDVYLIAGQSNAVGYGENVDDAKWNKEKIPESDTDSRYTEGFENVLYYGVGESNVFTEFTPVKVGQGQTNKRVGAEIGIAAAVADSGRTSAVIKYAIGGTPLTPANHTSGTWTPPSYIRDKGVDTSNGLNGKLYTAFIKTVTDGVAELKAQGYTPVLKGVWWMQGCAESNSSWRTEYATCLEYLINDMRADLGEIFATDTTFMPFVAGSIRSNHAVVGETAPKYLPEINQAQLAVQAKVPAFEIVDTSPNGFPEVLTPENIVGLTDEYKQQDAWHFTAKAQHKLGQNFVEKVELIESKYYVAIEAEDGVTYTGVDSYSAGATVTLDIAPRGQFVIDKVTKQVGTAEATTETLSDGKLTFTMPASNVKIKIETTDTNPEVTPYGNIPSYYPVSQYPFAVFKGNTLYSVYESWYSLVAQGSRIAAASQAGENVIYLRADYTSKKVTEGSTTVFTDDTQMLCHMVGEVTFDLGGNTITRGNTVFFRVMTKDGTANATTELTIKNGRMEASGGAPFYISTHTNASSSRKFIFNIEDVTFGLASGSTATNIITQTWSGNTTNAEVTAEIEFNLTDCTVDLKTVAPTASVTLFDTREDTADSVLTPRKTAVKLNNVKVNANALSDVTVVEKDSLDSFNADDSSVVNYTDGSESKSVAINTLIPVSTEYGEIPAEYADAEKYPFVIFKNGTFVSAEDRWSDYTDKNVDDTYYGVMITTRKNASATQPVDVLMRRDFTVIRGYQKWMTHFSGTVNFDLGGFTLTTANGQNLFAHTINANATRKFTMNMYNGGICVTSGAVVYENCTKETITGKQSWYKFTDIVFSFGGSGSSNTKNIIESAASKTGISNWAEVIFTDCTFDFTVSPSGAKIVSSGAGETHSFDIIINGGQIKAKSGLDVFNHSSNDDVQINVGSDGKYPIMEFSYSGSKNAIVPSNVYDDGNGGKFGYFWAGTRTETVGTVKTYYFSCTLEAASYYADYNTYIPKRVADDVQTYPFLTFAEDTRVSGDRPKVYLNADTHWLYSPATGADADAAVHGVMVTVRKGNGTISVHLRRDYENTQAYSDKWLGHLNATVNIYLDGHTITTSAAYRPLFRVYQAYTDRYPVYNIYNGTFLVKGSSVVEALAGTSSKAAGQVFSINFENVSFGYAEGATEKSFIKDGNVSDSTCYTNTTNFSFTNCNFDAVTNAPANAAPISLDNTKTNVTNVAFVGCKMLASNWESAVAIDENETLSFAKYDGRYITVELLLGASAPAGTYVGENGNVVFKNVGGTATTAIYALVIEEAASIDFAPMASITLDSNLILNIYIPEHAGLKSATLNGTPVALENAEGGYYIVSTALEAKEAAKTLTLVVVLDANDTELRGTFEFSTVKYADKLLKSGATEAEKTLAKDMLAYVKSAYNYFDSADKATVAEAINSVIGNYTAALKRVDGAAASDANDIIAGTTFALDSTPAIRFYLHNGSDASQFSFKVGGRLVSAEDISTGVEAAAGDFNGYNYVDISLYAYRMIENVTITKGADTATYHINYYYDNMDTANAAQVEMITAFYNYCVSANAYRAEVTK